jgi:hypothetical protein
MSCKLPGGGLPGVELAGFDGVDPDTPIKFLILKK